MIAIAVPFALTMIVGKKKLSDSERYGSVAETTAVGAETQTADTEIQDSNEGQKENGTSSAETHDLKAFLTGKVIPLNEVEDQVFSAGVMGEGLAIWPENDTLYAPAKGAVTMLTDTRHAIGMTLENGMEILLHVGLDTVEMNGDGFTYLVSENQKVEAGTALIRFDREKIKAAGHPDVTVCIVTDQADVEQVNFHTGMNAESGKTVIAEF